MVMQAARPTADRPLKVGLHLPNVGGMHGDAVSWSDLLVMARRAEELGFDSLWVADHLLMRFPGWEHRPVGTWEGWSLLAALAAATDRIMLGPLVSCATFRNPALLAKIAATVDEISGGRLILGLGAGWHEPEYTAFGYPYDHLGSRFDEALTIIAALLRDGPVDFVGRYYQARECELRPRGPRPGGIPIMIGAEGERLLRLTARHADAWNWAWVSSVDEVIPRQAAVDAACRDVGRDPATLERSVAVPIDLPGRPDAPPGGEAEVANWVRESTGTATGSPEELAALLRAFAAAGIAEVQVWLAPSTVAGVEAFAPVLELLDRG